MTILREMFKLRGELKALQPVARDALTGVPDRARDRRRVGVEHPEAPP